MNDHAIEAAARAMHAAKAPYEEDSTYVGDLWDHDGRVRASIDGFVDLAALARAAVSAYLAAMEAEAVMVPVEPTEDMLFQLGDTPTGDFSLEYARQVYGYLLASRPKIGEV